MRYGCGWEVAGPWFARHNIGPCQHVHVGKRAVLAGTHERVCPEAGTQLGRSSAFVVVVVVVVVVVFRLVLRLLFTSSLFQPEITPELRVDTP